MRLSIEYTEQEGREPVGLVVREEVKEEGELIRYKDFYDSIIEEVKWLTEKGYVKEEAEEDIMERLIAAVAKYVIGYTVVKAE